MVRTIKVVCLLAGLTAGSVQAALIDRGGGLIYDTILDVTWLQDANYYFGTLEETCFPSGPPGEGEGPGGEICFPPTEADSRLTFNEAVAFADALEYYDSARDVTWTEWRLPTYSPIDGSSTFNTSYSINASTDEGYAPSTTDGTDGGWRDGAGNPVSEMGHMNYVNLGNDCPDNVPGCTGTDPFNAGPFINLVKTDSFTNDYWTETVVSTCESGYFNFKGGFQGRADRDGCQGEDRLFVWTVMDGDVGVIPVPPAIWLFGSALGLLGWVKRKAR